MANTVAVAACNFCYRPVADFEEFGEHVGRLLDEAHEADLVVFPELLTFELFTTYEGWQALHLPDLRGIDEFTDAYRDLFGAEARRRGQYIAAGSHFMEQGSSYRNVGHLFGPEGEIWTHAKTHIFPGEAEWLTEEGDALAAIDLPFARVGFNICYEAEIPECASSLAEQGAEILICPSFTTSEHGFWRVRHCVQARCVENQMYAVHSSLGGNPGAPLMEGWARSSVLAPCDAPWTPNGVLAEATANREMVVQARLDLDLLRENRERGAATTYRDRRRRAGLYASWPSHV